MYGYVKKLAVAGTLMMLSAGVQASTLNEPGYTEDFVATIPGTTAYFGTLVEDGTGNLYSTSAWGNEVFEVDTLGVATQFGTTGGSGALGVGIIGSTLYVGFQSGEIRTMDLNQAAPAGVLLASLGSGVDAMGMAVAPAGFGAYGGQLVVGTYDGISIVNPANGAVSVLLNTPGNPHSDVAFTPDGVLLAVDYDNSRVVSVTAAGVESTFYDGISGPDGIAVHPSTGNVFVASSNLDAIVKIDPTGTSSSQFASDAIFDAGWFVSPIRFSTDGSVLYYGAGPSTLSIYAISGFDGAAPPPPNEYVPVPTLSVWGLAVLTLLIGLMVFASRRRRLL